MLRESSEGRQGAGSAAEGNCRACAASGWCTNRKKARYVAQLCMSRLWTSHVLWHFLSQRATSTLNFHLVLAPFLTTSMLQTAICTRILEGVQTDILLQAFADRIVVLVTQLGKVGSLVCPCFRICSNQFALTVSQIQATMPSTMPLLPPPLPDPSKPNSGLPCYRRTQHICNGVCGIYMIVRLHKLPDGC